MSRPRTNVDELERRHRDAAMPRVASPSKPATPLTNSGKGKFKPAKSMPTKPTPISKLGSFSTPGFGKVKPKPLDLHATDNDTPYINISSTESTPLNASTSSIPIKRFSSGSSEDFPPLASTKRPKITHQPPDKENLFLEVGARDKGKGRAREPLPSSPLHAVAPSRTAPQASNVATPALTSASNAPKSMGKLFEAMPHDIDLYEMSELQLRGVCSTAQDMAEACDRLIGAARASSEPKDLDSLLALSELFERRLSASRAVLKARQRGEKPAASSLPTANAHTSTNQFDPSTPSHPSRLPDPCIDLSTTLPEAPSSVAGPSMVVDAQDDDDFYWDSFPDHPTHVTDSTEEDDRSPRMPAPATPPATQPKSLPQAREVSPPESTTLAECKRKPYYPEVMKVLRNVFRLESFRPKQLEAICAAMDGRDVFVLFPTGSGKSLTFQIPAVLHTTGVTVVVGPLVSLIRDQVDALLKIGVDVVKLGGEQSDRERQEISARDRLWSQDKPRLVYLTPEQLRLPPTKRLLEVLYNRGQLVRFVIDEAHCITDWGRRFRDSYPELADLRKQYPNTPISALTATANAEVEQDILSRLDMRNCAQFRLSFNRKNLYYEVRPKKQKKCLEDIAQDIKQQYAGQTGIIYCLSRNSCEDVAKVLREDYGLQAKHYHAKMDHRDRERVQREWSDGKVLIIVATVAFGMGIDKADVRFVIHYSIPQSLAAYYQETGRAGRDGNPAQCILYYSFTDVKTRIDMIRKEDKSDDEKRWQEDDLWTVARYCMNDVRCRRQQVLAHFGEKFDPAHCNQLCDNCRDLRPITRMDHTNDAINALRLFENLLKMCKRNSGITKSQLVSALRGSKQRALVEKGFSSDALYGVLKGLPQATVDRLLDEMMVEGYLGSAQVQVGEYNQTYLKVGDKAATLTGRKKKLEIEFRVAGARTVTTASAKAPVSARSRKPRSKAQNDYDSGSVAGPSTAPASRNGRNRVPAYPQEDEENMRSLYVDDPDDPDFSDIEEISSPVPAAARRPGTRAVPSASQSLLYNMESDIEEIEPPAAAPPKVTVLEREEDLQLYESGTVEMQCKEELLALRRQMRPEVAQWFYDEVIETLAAILPNDREALRGALDTIPVEMDLLGSESSKILNICTRYHMQRG